MSPASIRSCIILVILILLCAAASGLAAPKNVVITLAPDYRLDSFILDEVARFILDEMPAAYAPLAIKKLGEAESGRYDGLRLTYTSAAAGMEIVGQGLIPEEIDLELGSYRMCLSIESVVNDCYLELRVLQAETDFAPDALELTKEALHHRLVSRGMVESDAKAAVRLVKGLNGPFVLVEVAEDMYSDDLAAMLCRTGMLNFRVDGRIVLIGDETLSAQVGYNADRLVINLDFGPGNTETLSRVTTTYMRKELSVYIDDDLLISAVIQEPIRDGRAMIHLGCRIDQEAAQKYAALMNEGLPVRLRLDHIQ